MSVLQNHSAVAARTPVARGVRFDCADDERNFAGIRGERVDVAFGRGDEPRAENKIHGRISANGQLGGDDEIRALFDEIAIGVENFVRVAGKIPDCRVDLCDAGVQETRGMKVEFET